MEILLGTTKVVDINLIQLGDRVRQEIGDVSDLIDTIKQVGLLHFPTVRKVNDDDQPYLLVSGARRWTAMLEMGATEIPVTILSDEQAEQASVIELVENEARKGFTPYEAIMQICKIHEDELADNSKHTMEMTGKLIGKSRGYVSGVTTYFNIYLKAVDEDPQPDTPEFAYAYAVENAKTMNDIGKALNTLKVALATKALDEGKAKQMAWSTGATDSVDVSAEDKDASSPVRESSFTPKNLPKGVFQAVPLKEAFEPFELPPFMSIDQGAEEGYLFDQDNPRLVVDIKEEEHAFTKTTKESLDFLTEWLAHNEDRYLVEDSITALPNVPATDDTCFWDIDPPYGVDYGKFTHDVKYKDKSDIETTREVYRTVLKEMFRISGDYSKAIIWHGSEPKYGAMVHELLTEIGWSFDFIPGLWIKPSGNSRNRALYMPRAYENFTVAYAPKAGLLKNELGKNWFQHKTTSVQNRFHPNAKPFELMEELYETIFSDGHTGRHFIPFAGGGASLAVCASKNYKLAYACDLSPEYKQHFIAALQDNYYFKPTKTRSNNGPDNVQHAKGSKTSDISDL